MKITRKLIIISVAIAVGGILAFIIGMSLLGWDFKKLDVAEYTAKAFQTSDAVDTVKLDVSSFPVKIQNGEELKLDYYEATNSDVTVGFENGVLTVIEKHKSNPFVTGIFNFGRFEHPYVLTVPSGTELNISGSNGNMDITASELGNVTVDVTNFDATFDNCVIGSLILHSTNLDLGLHGTRLADVSLESVNCDIDISDCGGNSLYIDATNLNAELTRLEFPDVTVVSTNVDIDLASVIAQTIDLKATNADISLVRATVDKLTVNATNLDADVEIVGNREDYTIESHGNRLPSGQTGTTDKKIVFSGTNNNVDLRFVS